MTMIRQKRWITDLKAAREIKDYDYRNELGWQFEPESLMMKERRYR